MSIPDGEYEIDLLVLAEAADPVPGNASLAIRYGFVPESMDQAQPLKLYQDDLMCLVEAQLTDKTRSAADPLPIIFEGFSQPLRLPQNAAVDFFHLAFLPKTPDGDVHVTLQKLSSIIRVNKSRNADKWRLAIKEWNLAPSAGGQGLSSGSGPASKRPPVPKTDDELLDALKKPKAPARPAVALPKPRLLAAAAPNLAKTLSPQPSAALHSREPKPIARGSGTTVKPEAEKRKAPAPGKPERTRTTTSSALLNPQRQSRKLSRANTPTAASVAGRPLAAKHPPKKASAEAKTVEPKDDFESDDFADLEDQLDEVLDENAASESDEDSEGYFAGGPIVIEGLEKETRKVRNLGLQAQQKKPMSLRDFHGGGQDDYLSSSEEE